MTLLELSVEQSGGDEELAALARDARSGNTKSFTALVRRVEDRVRRWARAITHDHDDADDVAQIVLLKLHAHIDQFEERSRFGTWLYRITRNVAFNRVVRERRRAELLEQDARRESRPESEELDDNANTGTQLAALVQHYLRALPPRQREAFELADLRGFNSVEVAERLGVTPSTARGLLMKARRRIRLRMMESHRELLEDYAP